MRELRRIPEDAVLMKILLSSSVDVFLISVSSMRSH